jgi:hypothetical protein
MSDVHMPPRPQDLEWSMTVIRKMRGITEEAHRPEKCVRETF